MESYLDINKSVIISSPAGSGKTEKLARRYIALLQSGVSAERILAITFTDKAAAEMKQRILRILNIEDRSLFINLLERMPLMRVSTIHSFCGTLLRRFSFEASIDPNYRVNDAIESAMRWEEILYEVLMDAGKGSKGHDMFLQAISEKGFRGLDTLRSTVDYLFQKSPFSLDACTYRHIPQSTPFIDELKSWPAISDLIEGYDSFFQEGPDRGRARIENYFLTKSREPRKRPDPLLKNISDYRDWAQKIYLYWKDTVIQEHVKRTEKIYEIYKECLHTYRSFKRSKGTLDFSDLEHIAFKMLTENPEWANILYAFDEKTDHILVDEFQDTNSFQWEIINSLTEEWRSGMGAKREDGTKPTIFFVGDEKQSIYFFRGANVEIFRRAKDKLSIWLGDEFHYEEVKENYRSRPAIVEFTNRVFSQIMAAGTNSPPWITQYSPISACRTGSEEGRVEIILLENEGGTVGEVRQKEADIIARRILELAENFLLTDRHRGNRKPCTFMDMAILLRKRTHLKKYEAALRQYSIPFVAVKGIGFYQEPEVAMLRALVFFLSNPRDDYNLYVLLKSPLFEINEGEINKIINLEGDCLYAKLNISGEDSLSHLREWRAQLPHVPVSELIERILTDTKAWIQFHEPQRQANIKKFIRIIENHESKGKSILRIRDFLEQTMNKNEEPKANVNAEGMNAVKLMTVHAAKGLEFPVVFVPGIEEPFTLKTGEDLLFEKEGEFCFKSEPEPSIRRQDEDFILHRAKEEEEQKRLFYVAATRAEEALVLVGQWNSRDRNFLTFLRQGLGLEKEGTSYSIETASPGLSVLQEEDVQIPRRHSPVKATVKKPACPAEVTALTLKKQTPWKSVTEIVDVKSQHGKGWVVIGDILHRIFEAVSKGYIEEGDIPAKTETMLDAGRIPEDEREGMISIIKKDIAGLRQKGIWKSIIAPQEGSYAELSFVYEEDDVVYRGRIDRLVPCGGGYRIYDYKTFPVKESDIRYFLNTYTPQLSLYSKAVMKLFRTQEVQSYIVFTHTGDVREVPLRTQ